MSAGDYSYGIQPGAAASHLITELAWSALMLPLVLFAWHQSHFQYDIYMPGDFGLMIYRLSVAAVLVLIATSSISNYKKQLVYMVLGYIVLAALHAVLDQILTAEGKLPYFLQAMAFSVMMLPIISDKRMLRRFIRVNFLLGMMLITLSTIPLLHWLDVLSLPYAQITRFAGETTRPDLDPLYFGLFGLTESYVRLAIRWALRDCKAFPSNRYIGHTLSSLHSQADYFCWQLATKKVAALVLVRF